MNQVRILFAAVMFYTRIPCPQWFEFSKEDINKSIRFFPFIGWIVGGFAAAVFILGQFLIGDFFGAVLFTVASVWITGAFHEDGFADVCDGFGGGWTKAQVLKIMKDSRVGAYGAIGIVLLLLIKISLVIQLGSIELYTMVVLLIGGHSLSRFNAATIVFTHKYVRDTDDSKAKPVAKSSSWTNVILSFVFGIMPIVFLGFYSQKLGVFFLIPMTYLITWILANYFKKRIGGYTGDCLGAAQQLSEVSYYFFAFIIWKFI